MNRLENRTCNESRRRFIKGAGAGLVFGAGYMPNRTEHSGEEILTNVIFKNNYVFL